MSETVMELSMDVLKALNPDATENTIVEFDSRGSIHLIERDDEGNDVVDFEVVNKHFEDYSDIPSLDKRLLDAQQKSLRANTQFITLMAILGALTALAIFTLNYIR